MYKLFFLVFILISIFSSDCQANELPLAAPLVYSVNKNPFNYNLKTLDSKSFIPIRELLADFTPTILWDEPTNTATLSYNGIELVFKNNSHVLLINKTPYQLSSSPYIKQSALCIPLGETYSLLADYLLNTQQEKIFFPDLSSISMAGSYECRPSFPKLFFYKDSNKSNLVTISRSTPLDILQSIFNFQHSREIFGDRLFYRLSSDMGISGYFVEEYTDESLTILSNQNLHFVSVTSPKFFTDKLISVGATKTEVQERYGYPEEGFSSNIWNTIDSAEGRATRFHFSNGILTKFEYGKCGD